MRYPFLVSLFIAAVACKAPHDTPDDPDNTVGETHDTTDTTPDETRPDDPNALTATVRLRTFLDDVEEPCMAKIVDHEGFTLAEGMTFEELQANNLLPGDVIYVIPGTEPILPSVADFIQGIDPPTGSFYRHRLEDGSSALALAVAVIVPENGEIGDVDIPFHRFADGEWTVAYPDRREVWGRVDDVQTHYIDNPNTPEIDPILATQWGSIWGIINGSTIASLPGLQDGFTLSGSWRADGLIDLTVNMGVDQELIAYPGVVDPR